MKWLWSVSPSEGERKMRESASPSEGGKGPLGGGTRQYGVLEAVLRLLTFGRCAENAGKCLTFGRWEGSAGRWNAAVWCSGGGTAFTHLRKVCGKRGKVPHLRKVGKVRWEVERGSMVLWQRLCIYAPSEGVRKTRESASPSEGGKGPLGGGTRQYGALAAVVHLRTFGRCAENVGKLHTFGRWER